MLIFYHFHNSISNYTNEKKLSFEKDETNENRIFVTFTNPKDRDVGSLNERLSNYINYQLDQTEIEEKLELIICDLLILGYFKEIYSYRSKEWFVEYKFDKMNYTYKIYRQVGWWIIPFMILLIGVPFFQIRTKLIKNKK